jgi:hypothetical protein
VETDGAKIVAIVPPSDLMRALFDALPSGGSGGACRKICRKPNATLRRDIAHNLFTENFLLASIEVAN